LIRQAVFITFLLENQKKMPLKAAKKGGQFAASPQEKKKMPQVRHKSESQTIKTKKLQNYKRLFCRFI
jgi:hypothetical protein